MAITILITTAVRPPKDIPYLRMAGFEKRTLLTKAAIFFWAGQDINNLVIADATNSTILNAEEVAMLEKMNINVEQIPYQQDEASTVELGKGYAEGQLIEHAIRNSRMLLAEENFFKCTGKVFCRNFSKVSEFIKNNSLSGVYWARWLNPQVNFVGMDTRFYYTSKNYFMNSLLPGYRKANDGKKKIAEAACAEELRKNLPMSRGMRPALSGYSGGSNAQYPETSLGDVDSNFPCWIEKQQGHRGLQTSVRVRSVPR